MILEPNELYEISGLFWAFCVLKILSNNLFEPIDNELFLERRISFQSKTKLLIGFIFVFQPLKLKECKRQP